jgi:hypothetical protein
MVVVQGQRLDLERAVEVLAGSDVRIVGEDDGFFLEAPEVSEAADAADARLIAEGITLRLAGMLRLEFTLVSPITVGSVVEIEDDGSRRIHGSAMPQAATLVLHMGRPVVSISGGKPAPPIDRGIDVALRQRDDPQVALVACLLAEGPSWSTIYKIIDAVGDDVGGINKLKRNAWIPEKEFRRIALTANAHEMALDGGRHATRDISLQNSTLRAIPLDEAWSGVTRLVDTWLRWRASVVPPGAHVRASSRLRAKHPSPRDRPQGGDSPPPWGRAARLGTRAVLPPWRYRDCRAVNSSSPQQNLSSERPNPDRHGSAECRNLGQPGGSR